MARKQKVLAAIAALCVLALGMSVSAGAQERAWQVTKSSGDVWITTAASQQVSLGADTALKPGDSIRTGRNGRVLLVRGEERIMVLPNTAIGIPSEQKPDLPTSITQQVGTILLEVEKRNVQHFEVETPYLAAVVKGTKFRVTVEKNKSRVDVFRGQVQVSDFKSGQNVLVLPGQAARTSVNGSSGLLLSGRGEFNPIEHGIPRQTTVRPIPVPSSGLRAPPSHDGQQTRALRAASRSDGTSVFASASKNMKTDKGALHIGAPIGEVKVDFKKVTDGLAHPAGSPALARDTSEPGGSSASAGASAAGSVAGSDPSAGLASASTGGGSSASAGAGSVNGSTPSGGLASASSGLGGGATGGSISSALGGTGGSATSVVSGAVSGASPSGGGSGLIGTTVGVVGGVVGGVTGLLKKK
jgi:FecR-like protein